MGTLAVELRRSDDRLADEVRELVIGWLDWLAEQFRRVGADGEAQVLAARLFGELQGAAVLALALGDPGQVDRAVARCEQWIGEL